MDWFSLAYTKYYDDLYRIAQYQLQSTGISYIDADDLVQDAFLALNRKKDQLTDHPNIGGWLCKTLCYNISNIVRKEDAAPLFLDTLVDSNPNFEMKNMSSAGIEEAISCRENKERLDGIEQVIGSENIELLYKHYVDGEPLAKLSEQAGISEAALKMKLYRLRLKIKMLGTKNLTIICVTFIIVTLLLI